MEALARRYRDADSGVHVSGPPVVFSKPGTRVAEPSHPSVSVIRWTQMRFNDADARRNEMPRHCEWHVTCSVALAGGPSRAAQVGRDPPRHAALPAA
jgi:hypothetical protein